MIKTSREAMEQSESSQECCMCGDYGFSCELFQCKVCQFRSQHRYCSNLYPKAESYEVCNWCLNQEDTKEKSQNSSNSSSSHKNNREHDGKVKRKNGSSSDNHKSQIKGQRDTSQLLQPTSTIKKQRSSEESPPIRKRIITNGQLEEKLRRIKSEENLRRTKSEEMTHKNNGITKQAFRNKVRRYKLLDDVSS